MIKVVVTIINFVVNIIAIVVDNMGLRLRCKLISKLMPDHSILSLFINDDCHHQHHHDGRQHHDGHQHPYHHQHHHHHQHHGG